MVATFTVHDDGVHDLEQTSKCSSASRLPSAILTDIYFQTGYGMYNCAALLIVNFLSDLPSSAVSAIRIFVFNQHFSPQGIHQEGQLEPIGTALMLGLPGFQSTIHFPSDLHLLAPSNPDLRNRRAFGQLTIQLARLSGYQVITIASPRIHEFVRSLRADVVFDVSIPVDCVPIPAVDVFMFAVYSTGIPRCSPTWGTRYPTYSTRYLGVTPNSLL